MTNPERPTGEQLAEALATVDTALTLARSGLAEDPVAEEEEPQQGGGGVGGDEQDKLGRG